MPLLRRYASPCIRLFATFVFLAAPWMTRAQEHPPAAHLQAELDALAARAAPGTLGVAVMDLQSGARWGVHPEQAFPMMSDFKAPIAAAVLARVDAGSMSLAQPVKLTPADFVDGSASPSIGDQLARGPMTVTVEQLLVAAVSHSDNTSADMLLRLLGGPAALTQFLHEKGIAGMRIRDDERGMATIFEHRSETTAEHRSGASAAPAQETAAQKLDRLRAGYKAYLAAPPNQTTPDAAALFLAKLWQNKLASPGSTQLLLGWMYAQTVPHRLRDGVQPPAHFADKTGTGNTVDGATAAYNDMGLISWPDGHAVAIAAYLTDVRMPPAQRDALLAQVARAVVAAVRQPGE